MTLILLLLASPILIPFDVRGGTANLDDVQSTIPIDVDDRTTRGRHAHRIKNLVTPLTAGVVLGIEDVRTGNFSLGAIARNDVIPTISVEIANAHFVPLFEFTKNDTTLPGFRFVLCVNNDLVAVPGLNSSEDPLLLQPTDSNVASPGPRRLFFMAFR
jgi:hypothetical protein